MSVILDFVDGLDMCVSARKVMARVSESLAREGARSDVLAKLIDMKSRRLSRLIVNEGAGITRDEVRNLCLATATGLEAVFGLPDLKDDATVRKEFALLQQQPGEAPETQIFFCGPGEPITSLDVMRSVVYLAALRMCLDRYPG